MYAVIMAGGRGTRFWPLSREKKPKHLLDVTGAGTILQTTVERITPLIPEENIYIITSKTHCDEIKAQCPHVPEENIIAEPLGRNTAPCIGLAAIYIKQRDPEGVMVVLPADHIITNENRFLTTVTAAETMARRGKYLITIGIEPTKPETGYGYIEQGDAVASIEGKEIYRVRSFREKPDLDQAKKFLEVGTFLWNSGTFVWKVSTILEQLATFLPDLHEGILTIEKALGTEHEKGIIREIYEGIGPISIDYGVMEKADDVVLVRGEFGWNDIGSWDALFDVFSKDEMGNSVTGPVIALNSRDSLVYSPDKLVALIGVDNLVVVETEDSLLICRREHTQDVKEVVEILEKHNMKDYL